MGELQQAKQDEAWWKKIGDPLGLTLIGWTYRNTALFTPDEPSVAGWGTFQVRTGDALFRLLSRLSDEKTGTADCIRQARAAGIEVREIGGDRG